MYCGGGGNKEVKTWLLFNIKSLWDKLWTFLRPASQESSTACDMQKSHRKWLPDEKGILFCILLELKSYQEAYNMLQNFQELAFFGQQCMGVFCRERGNLSYVARQQVYSFWILEVESHLFQSSSERPAQIFFCWALPTTRVIIQGFAAGVVEWITARLWR